MDHQIFLSYPAPDEDLVENFAEQLLGHGIKAWTYSIDKTLSYETWTEIKARIEEAEFFAFLASDNSRNAGGQHRELEMAVKKVQQASGNEFRLLPIAIDDLPFRELPDELRNVNGIRLNAHNVKSMAQQVAQAFFPDLFDTKRDEPWKCPRVGHWLEVCKLDEGIEEYFKRGDLLYFRRLSPLGLFECYSPDLNELFWISPENVCASKILPDAGPPVPEEFRYITSFRFEMLGRKYANHG